MQRFIRKSLNSNSNENIKKDNFLYSIYPRKFDNTNPNYIKINDKYVSSLIVADYEKEMEAVFLDKIISLEVDLQMSIFYEKQSTAEVIKKITFNIGNTGAELKNSANNPNDIEIMSTSYSDAKYIRKQLQIANEQLYYIYIYISVYNDTLEGLNSDIQKIESIASGIGLKTRKALFRQKEIFDSTIPIMNNSNSIKEYCKRNVLTSGIAGTYPFVSNELCDENGILIGVNDFNESIVMVDRFNTNKYKNSNMCIIGTSGSGKSYFTKLMIARNRYLNILQYVIDPEGEYIKICEKLSGDVIDFAEGKIINLMDIRENSVDDKSGYLQSKINKLNTFFSLCFPTLNQNERNSLEEKILQCYMDKGINFDDESLYKSYSKSNFISKKRFKKTEDMPTLEDLYNLIKKDKNMKNIKILLKPYIDGSMKFLNGHTNVNLDNPLIVVDIHNVEEKNLAAVMFVVTEFFWDKIKTLKSQRKILYLDEVWRLIGNNEETANFVFKMFKTIRKYGGAATAITQDINDFFSLDEGRYGKAILNNSSIKTIFQLEETDINILKNNINLSEEEVFKIQNAKRGTCLLYAGSNHLYIKIKASLKEHQYISTDRMDNL